MKPKSEAKNETKSETPPQSANQTVEVSADAVQLEPSPPAQLPKKGLGSSVGRGALTAGKSGLPMLPSGLPMVSTVAAGRVTLALDAMGTLFVSEDIGAKWERVASQWKGRATKVRLAGAAVGSLFAAREKSAQGEDKKSPAVVPLFEIVSDSNEVWTSADGKTWTPK